ncbi:MAG: PD40 domain-containing protein [Deltaproteobacteria bacterium]|nr:MAG: PD40 domain-containing protein [Deltaproteobacteria bacterium]
MDTLDASIDVGNRDSLTIIDRATPTPLMPRIERANIGVDGMIQRNACRWPSLSYDARFISYWSFASGLVSGDTNNIGDIFVRDRIAGRIERINVGPMGIEANGDSDMPLISSDGRFVVFDSAASNLVSGDTNGVRDVFVRDRTLGITERISISSSGEQGNGPSRGGYYSNITYQIGISGDGRFVTFVSGANNLVNDDGNRIDDIFVRDRLLGRTERVSVGRDGGDSFWRCGDIFGGPGVNFSPSISDDGRYVVFSSRAANLIAEDVDGCYVGSTYLRDRLLGSTRRISFSFSGSNPILGLDYARISGNGNILTYSANVSLIAPRGTSDVFSYQLDIGRAFLTSVSLAGGVANGESFSPYSSVDGQFIIFGSEANNLDHASATVHYPHLFVRNLPSGVTRLIDFVPTPTGLVLSSRHSGFNISPDGKYAVFIAADRDDSRENVFVVSLDYFFSR